MKSKYSNPGAPSIVWFRLDLRLADNPALAAAVVRGGPVIPIFIWSPEDERDWPPGRASQWWLHQSLAALDKELDGVGSKLIMRSGTTLTTLKRLIRETNAGAVFWNRRYEPAIIDRDTCIKQELQAAGLLAQSHNAALLHEPWTIQNKSGKPFQVFTPFWRHCLNLPEPPAPLSTPPELRPPQRWPESIPLSKLKLEPVPDWAGGLRASWTPGTAGANANLERFLTDAFAAYEESRNHPAITGTSRLSPHLHFGEISPRQVWHALKRMCDPRGRGTNRGGSPGWRQSQFVAELGWREFSHHLLYHFPHTPTAPLRQEFAGFSWRRNRDWMRAWQRGQTGYPMVDAGMRELWSTGWMHNRVRMIVASFLIKDLMISWQEGARWFWDTLVDADLAQNTLGWQWTAGCGADAAPFFRIFNPVSQGEKFDPNGDYIRQWVPELAGLPKEWVQKPHAAPADVLARAKVIMGKTYPEPIVNHAIAREVALEAYAKIRRKSAP